MTAESLPFSSCTPAPSTLTSWELEAWYEDLQDVLLSDVNGSKSAEMHQSEMKVWDIIDASSIWQPDPLTTCCQMDMSYEPSLSLGVDDLSESLLEFLVQDSVPSLCSTSASPEVEEQVPVVVESDSSSVHHTEDEDSSSPVGGGKRKRGSQPRGGKRLKEREQEGDKKVSELMVENERLKVEIERLSAEVERTRKALIDRMVNLKKE